MEVVVAGHSPYAPHLFCTQFLDDNVEADRQAGIAIGLEFLAVCNELWWWTRLGDPPSSGMRAEIRHAEALGIPVRKRSP